MHKNKKEQIALNNAKVLERLRSLKQIKSQKLKNENEINLVDSTQTKQFKIQSNRQSTHESKKQKKINKQSNKEITQKENNQIKYGQDEQSARNQQEEEMKRKKIDCSVNRKAPHNQSQSKQNCKQWKLQQVNEIVEFKGLRDERFLNDPAIGIEIDQSQTQKALEQKDGKNNNRLYKNTHCNCIVAKNRLLPNINIWDLDFKRNIIFTIKPAAIKNAHVNNFLKIALNNVNAIENYVVVLFVL